MRTTSRVVAVLVAAAAAVGCADAPSAPNDARTESITVPLASDMAPDSTGACRGGYVVINGRCEPAGP